MKKLTISLFVVVFYLILHSLTVFAQDTMWQNIEKVIGKEGVIKDETEKFTFPRYDLSVKIKDLTIEPALALTSWVIFIKMQDKYIIMGDLILKETEVDNVTNKLVSNELQITALHNHILNETPKIMYLHFSGQGDAVVLARRIRTVLEVTATPFTPAPLKKISESTDWSKVESILGYSGKATGKILQFSIARKEVFTEKNMALPPQAGMAISINFQSAGDKVAATGDFLLTAEEVNPVVKVLTENNILVTAIHNHMLFESPRLFFLHFWSVDNPERLAEGLHLALEKINIRISQ